MSTVEEAPTHSESKYSIYERGKTEELISERTIRIKGNSVDIKGYDPRLSNQLDNFHRFPQLLDEIIVDNHFFMGYMEIVLCMLLQEQCNLEEIFITDFIQLESTMKQA